MITVLGATGNVGSKVTDLLMAKGEKVRVIARTADLLRSYVRQGAEAFAGDAKNPEFLAQAFKGSDSVLTMVPTEITAKHLASYQNSLIGSIRTALREARIRYVVNLSSLGAQYPEGTGPIAGLHRMEEVLNKIDGLNVVHLRAAFFMENLLMQIPLVRSNGKLQSDFKGTLKIPLIATRDIAEIASDCLIKRDFTGSSIRELLGPRDISFNEIAKIIGKALHMPKLGYVQLPYEDVEKSLVDAGFSPDVAGNFVEMGKAFNDGKIGKGLVRTAENTTPTSIEQFVSVDFIPIYRESGEAKAA